MRRTFARVGAWIAATAISIVIANAAVGSVRAQVSDLPQAVAANAVATGVTVGSTPTVSSTTTTSMTAARSTTSTTANPTTSATTAAAATTPPTSPPTTTTRSEIQTFSVTGGRVTIEVFSDRIRLLGAVPDPGYSVAEVEQSDRQIEIEFKAGETENKFKAHFEDGRLVVEVEGAEGSGD